MEWNQEYCLCCIYSVAKLRTDMNRSQNASPKLNLIQDRPRCLYPMLNPSKLQTNGIKLDSLQNLLVSPGLGRGGSLVLRIRHY